MSDTIFGMNDNSRLPAAGCRLNLVGIGKPGDRLDHGREDDRLGQFANRRHVGDAAVDVLAEAQHVGRAQAEAIARDRVQAVEAGAAAFRQVSAFAALRADHEVRVGHRVETVAGHRACSRNFHPRRLVCHDSMVPRKGDWASPDF